jgi:hypothetical protein
MTPQDQQSRDISELVKMAVARYEAMAPHEKAVMSYEQRRSYVRGELMIEHENMTADEANKLIDAGEIKMGIVRP